MALKVNINVSGKCSGLREGKVEEEGGGGIGHSKGVTFEGGGGGTGISVFLKVILYRMHTS